jgi:hypothetical protein
VNVAAKPPEATKQPSSPPPNLSTPQARGEEKGGHAASPTSAHPAAAASDGAKIWYAVILGQQRGPFSIGELAAQAQAFEIHRDTLVWKQGMSGWVRAAESLELRSVFSAQSQSPLPVAPPPDSAAASIPETQEKPKGFWATVKEAADKASKVAAKAQRDHQVVFVSGPFDLKTKSVGTLTLEDNELVFKSLLRLELFPIPRRILPRELFRMPYDSIVEATVDTAERMTLTRVWLLSIFAFGFKKKDKLLKLDFHDQSGLNVTVVFGKASFGTEMDTLSGKILANRREALVRQARAAPPTIAVRPPDDTTIPREDVCGLLQKLGSLRERGILTEEEFQKKKSELLSRL